MSTIRRSTPRLAPAFSLREIAPPSQRFPLPVSHSRAPLTFSRVKAALCTAAVFAAGFFTAWIART